ncbi:MAG TPA: hypothetical protein VKA08_12480 [Balneolales bacterium]|nr:hypothetical protein [Balneolales bacterium]
MKHLILITLAIGMYCSLAKAQTKMSVMIPEGASVKLTLMQRLDSGDKGLEVGDKVRLQAAEDVTVGGKVIIDRYAEAEGHVIEKKHSKWLGRKGKIDFEIDWVKAVDGTKIPLRAVARKGGKSHVAGMVAVTALVSPIGLLMRGKNAVVKRGTEFTAYVNTEEHIAVR